MSTLFKLCCTTFLAKGCGGNNYLMRSILSLLQQRSQENWLLDRKSEDFFNLYQHIYQQLISRSDHHDRVLIIESEPWQFLAAFLASLAANSDIFLGNHHWQEKDWRQVFSLIQPNLIIKNSIVTRQNCVTNFSNNFPLNDSLIMIPTGGSSGQINFAIHNWSTLTASIQGFKNYFQVDRINSFCVLPLYHVAGLMQCLRSLLIGGKLVILPYSELKNRSPIDTINVSDFFISLVPTQLQFLLDFYPDWLSNFQTVLLGGAPAWRSLLDTARNHQIPLAPTYGMTETASQIVTLKPTDFLENNNSNGFVLPHAKIKILDEFDRILDINQTGKIAIKSDSLCLGYYPDLFRDQEYFITDDLGYFDDRDYLYIVGRNSQKIITGGENVFPAEVEAAILSTQLVTDVCVVGLDDQYWGQIVVAIYVPSSKNVTPDLIQTAIASKITKYKHPKSWIATANLPRNDQGKIEYQKVLAIATNQMQKTS